MISSTLQPVVCSRCHNANRLIDQGSDTVCFNCEAPLFDAVDPDIAALCDSESPTRTPTTAEQLALEPKPLTELERLRIRVVQLERELAHLPAALQEAGNASYQHIEHKRGTADAISHVQFVLRQLGL
jgi:hypothetical protein